ncbi:MAG: hypothetical protein HOK81_05820 [Rhodospirillaceae bacterium]|jgi:hypothetical protein|nr:hypothetical protein [Rhodospirillaceae bacterium]
MNETFETIQTDDGLFEDAGRETAVEVSFENRGTGYAGMLDAVAVFNAVGNEMGDIAIPANDRRTGESTDILSQDLFAA